jgi:hypothetical protein
MLISIYTQPRGHIMSNPTNDQTSTNSPRVTMCRTCGTINLSTQLCLSGDNYHPVTREFTRAEYDQYKAERRPAAPEAPVEGPGSAVRERIAGICREAGVAVEASDIVKPDPNVPAYTIDGMPWKQWLEAMVEAPADGVTIYQARNPFTGAVEFLERPGSLTAWAGYVRAGFSDGRTRHIGWSNADTEAAALAEITRGTMSGLEVAVVPLSCITAGERAAYLGRRAMLAPTEGERAKWAATLTMAAVDRLRAPDDEQPIAREHVADMVDQAMHFLGASGLDRGRYESLARRLTTAADITARWFLIVESNLGGRRADEAGIEAKLTTYLVKRDALITRLEAVTLAALAPR